MIQDITTVRVQKLEGACARKFVLRIARPRTLEIHPRQIELAINACTSQQSDIVKPDASEIADPANGRQRCSR